MNEDIRQYRNMFVIPGLIAIVVGLILFIMFSNSALSVVGILVMVIGAFFVVHAKSEINKIRNELRIKFIKDEVSKEYEEAKFSISYQSIYNEYVTSKIPLIGNEVNGSNFVSGIYGGFNFKLCDIDMTSKKYIRGDDSQGSRTETKSIFNGVAFFADNNTQSEDYIVISPKKNKKRYSFNGESKYLYKNFKVESSSKDYEAEVIDQLFLEAFFRTIDKYGPIHFSKVNGKYTLLINRPQIFNFKVFSDKVRDDFEYELSIPKDLIKNLID